MIDLGQYASAQETRDRYAGNRRPFAGVKERAALSLWIDDENDARAARFVKRCRLLRSNGRAPKIEGAKA